MRLSAKREPLIERIQMADHNSLYPDIVKQPKVRYYPNCSFYKSTKIYVKSLAPEPMIWNVLMVVEPATYMINYTPAHRSKVGTRTSEDLNISVPYQILHCNLRSRLTQIYFAEKNPLETDKFINIYPPYFPNTGGSNMCVVRSINTASRKGDFRKQLIDFYTEFLQCGFNADYDFTHESISTANHIKEMKDKYPGFVNPNPIRWDPDWTLEQVTSKGFLNGVFRLKLSSDEVLNSYPGSTNFNY